MTNTKWTKEKELHDRLIYTYPYRLGNLSGSCKTAIIELETFLENRKDVLSESDYNYLDSTMKALKVGLENSVNNKF